MEAMQGGRVSATTRLDVDCPPSHASMKPIN